MAGSQQESKDPRPSEYAREALSQWGKATRYAAKAAMIYAAARKARAGDGPALLERLNPAKTDKGGRLGSVADTALSKLGGPGGKLASKVGAGSRMVERVRNGSGDDESEAPAAEPAEAAANGNGFHGHLPIPIQESVEVATPVRVAYDLFTRFEDYPDFLDRVESAERVDETHAVFVVKLRGRQRELKVEIADERAGQRLDWECAGEIAHSGVISFHELAPRLTHIELTIELEPEGVLDRLTRGVGLTQRAIRADLHRFKAYAELEPEDQEAEDQEPEDQEPEDQEPEASAQDEEEPAADEDEIEEGVDDEADLDEEDLEDDEELVDEADLDDEEELDDEELDDDEELVDEEELDDEDEADPEDDEELVDEEDEDLDDDDELVNEEDLEDEELEDEDFEDDEQPDPARAWR
jgi:uncharacterized membrane protein